jgi:putative ABC transport system permease protein
VDELWQDLRFGLRTLRNSPGFTVVALLTLAVGIGANTAIFSFVDGVLLKPLPYENANRIMRVLEKPPGDASARNGISTLNFLDWQRQNTTFQYMAARSGGSVTLTGVANPIQLRGATMSAHGFDIFGVRAALGRTFAPDEDQPGKNRVVVLSHSLWVSQFGSDPKIVGRIVQLDGIPHTVIGVLSEGSAFDRSFAQLYRPLVFEPQNMTRNFHWFGAYGLLKPGVKVERAQAEMRAIGARIAHDYPDSNKGWSVAVDPLADTIVGQQLRRSLYVLMAAVGLVLLIGCANLANLTLSRSTVREREVAIRASVGAARTRLIRQFLTESVLLSVIGGILGIGLGYAMVAALRASLPPFSLPAEADIRLDWRVLLFALGVSVLTGLIFGLAPAIQATRTDLAGSMKEGGRGASTGSAKHRLRSGLVIAEVALSFLLLVGSGLLIRSFFEIQNVDTGFNAENVITAGIPIPSERFPDPDNLRAYLRQIDEAIRGVPGVRDVALTSALPMQGWGFGMPFQIANRPVVDRANRQACFFKMVSASYFSTLGITLKKGRALSEHDLKGGPPVAVINETMVRKYFPHEEPLGKQILVQEIVPGKTALGPEIPWEIVGVVKDEKVGNLDDTQDNPGMYVTNEQSPTFFQSMVVRSVIDPLQLQQEITRAIHQVNKDQALNELRTLEQIKTQSMAGNRLNSLMLACFAGVALLLSAIGIYGVISYSVVQRTHEIGIRSALGASSTEVVNLILRTGMVMAGAGLLLGVVGAILLTRLLATLLFGVGARDPLTMVGVGALLAAVALLASYLPAKRAAKVDPMICLRYE